MARLQNNKKKSVLQAMAYTEKSLKITEIGYSDEGLP